jgi:hypothetical protein
MVSLIANPGIHLAAQTEGCPAEFSNHVLRVGDTEVGGDEGL